MSAHQKKAVISIVLSVVLFPLRVLLPLRKKVLFISFEGGSLFEYSCNPKYVCEYMIEHHRHEFEYVWLVEQTHLYEELSLKGIKLYRHRTFGSIIQLLTSKYIISNGAYLSWFPFRKDQRVINTWHGGGAYKKLEPDIVIKDWGLDYKTKLSAKNTSLFVSSSEYFSKYVIRGAFRYEGMILESGMPRNDLLFKDHPLLRVRVCEQFGVDSSLRVALYAPTFRNHPVEERLDIERLRSCLSDTYGGSWSVWTRFHKQEISENRFISDLDVSDYPDVQELLVLADILITDYSSMVWDYSITGKPCFLYVPDIEVYVRDRGFYVSMDQWPFLQARTNRELAEGIQGLDQQKYQSQMLQHQKQFGSYESGNASKQLVSWIMTNHVGGRKV